MQAKAEVLGAGLPVFSAACALLRPLSARVGGVVVIV